MTTLELEGGIQAIVESSNAWDARYKLPLVPMHRNPAIYCAYLFKLIKDRGAAIPEEWKLALVDFYYQCLRNTKTITTLPGSSDVISHDDMIGWAWLSGVAAEDISIYLMRNAGTYGEKEVSRLVFVTPFILTVAFKRCSYFFQLNYSLHVLFHWLKYDKKNPQDSGTLKLWLMNGDMEKLPLCAPFIFFWRWRMKKLGVTIHKIFSERYLTEVPVFEILSRGMNRI